MLYNNSSTVSPTNLTTHSVPVAEDAELSNTTQIIFLAAYIIVALIGLIGNIITCYAIIKHKHLSKLVHCYTLNLAVADLLVIIFYVPVEVIRNENNMVWTMGEPLCRFNYCIIPTSLVASICTLIAITLDRHRGVSKPLHWRGDSKSMVKISIPLIWLVAIISSVPFFVVVRLAEHPPGSGEHYCYEAWSSPTSERTYWITMFSLQVLLPLVMMIVLNIDMFRILRRYQLGDKGYHKKIIKMTVGLVCVYAVCTAPQHIFFFLHSYGDLRTIDEHVQMVMFKASNLLLIIQMALNPVIYGTLGDLKRSFKSILHFTKFYTVLHFPGKRSSNAVSSEIVVAENQVLTGAGNVYPLDDGRQRDQFDFVEENQNILS
eukprot:Seg224.2 transcript_id=Seg224.2/GoldUCD/mRNA.D3Y31 product="Neuropeptide Y receptor type 1" protein_id=Seg224.2/GoldUCD/D3Y31